MRHLQKAGTAKIWSLRRPEVKRPQDLGALEALDGRRAVGAPDFCGRGGITCNSLLMNCRYCLTAQFVLRQTRTPVFAVELSADG